MCEVHGVRDGQSFALLAAWGRDVSGAVEVVAGGVDTDDEPDEDAEPSPRLGAPPAPGFRLSALAGMQLKFSMSMVNDRLALPAGGAGGQWIVKLPGRDYPDLSHIEAATMTWARYSGFEVPVHFVRPVAELDGIPRPWLGDAVNAFVVQRFDRRKDGGKVHQEDLCQALGQYPDNKYGNQPHKRISFDGALRLVTDLSGEDVGREMARRMGFAIASGNGDAHLKNWSLLWGDATRPTLTPCYDLVSTVSFPSRLGWDQQGGPRLALRLGDQEHFACIDRNASDALAKKSRQPWATEELISGIELARVGWRQVEPIAPQVMREAIERHWRMVPLLGHVGLTR